MTLEQVRQYLGSIGAEVPDELITAWIAIVDDYKDCLEKNYSPAVIVALYYYIIALLSVSFSVKYTSSVSIGGEIAESYRYTNPDSVWKSQLSLLRTLDTNSCLNDLIPENPFSTANGLLLTVRAKGCMK